ncbi:base excision DNA repair protein, HhH-GPD family [Leptospira inadai serovar Lyme str. 10]|uniref:DNA-3-methyladenine glycosylase II n=2 Tax=Leptospira inadai serovar Lyme TaxID=293084 RepID=V6H8M5_9LEPT|nr:DNA-3-methyladenine glycosylase [Leptospira inadai]EQA35117.1 base excision DNA repair protein, HhH-GPD family [Leptospira inadai serovar Lyme str. 10]PNV73945.1 DNA-3-methyladenine glycosylase 2 family protein [Leptospira inadai serovar Lyme]
MDREVRLRKAESWLRRKDPVMRKLITGIGPCTLKMVGSPYHVLIKSVISQQLSVKAAATMENRVIERFGSRKRFPEPNRLLGLSAEELRSAGLSFAKVATVRRIATAYDSGEITDRKLRKLEDEKVLEFLCSIKGVGPWTAEMVLMFALDRWDHFSLNDLILRKSIERHFGIHRNSKKEILALAGRFSPYRTIFSWYLWRDADGGEGW